MEIFHNTTLKNSESVVFSKPSKLGRQTKSVKKPLIEPAAQKIQEKSFSEHVSRERPARNRETRNKEPQPIKNPPPQTLNQTNTE